jgi:hypothetical protein
VEVERISYVAEVVAIGDEECSCVTWRWWRGLALG